jgi:hypothetical protein
LRGRGYSHGRALLSIADRLLNVGCLMLKNRTLFNPYWKSKNILAERRGESPSIKAQQLIVFGSLSNPFADRISVAD